MKELEMMEGIEKQNFLAAGGRPTSGKSQALKGKGEETILEDPGSKPLVERSEASEGQEQTPSSIIKKNAKKIGR